MADAGTRCATCGHTRFYAQPNGTCGYVDSEGGCECGRSHDAPAPVAEEWCAFHHQHHGPCGTGAKPVADGGEILTRDIIDRLHEDALQNAELPPITHLQRTSELEIEACQEMTALRAEVKRLKAERNRARADGYKRGAEDARRIWAKDADIEAHNKLLSSALSDEVREHMDDNRKLRAALDSATRALREIADHCRAEAAPTAWRVAAAALAREEGNR